MINIIIAMIFLVVFGSLGLILIKLLDKIYGELDKIEAMLYREERRQQAKR